MAQLNRRRFLLSVGGGGAVAGLSTALLLSKNGDLESEQEVREGEDTGGSQPADQHSSGQRSWTRRSWALGSTVSMTVVHEDRSHANLALDAAFAELELVESVMSIYRPTSQVSLLNRTRTLDAPHPYLLDVLQCARRMSQRTDGAFDVTIQPLWQLYATAQRDGKLPTAADVEIARGLVDWRRVETDAGQVRLRGEGTKITLNGIAQGFAADRVAETLRSHGIQHALIDTGEIGSLGAKSPRENWKVGIQHPRDPDAYISLARLAERCLATSGDYATTFTADRKHHHLFDPRTGHSPTELSSVSIAASSALAADALSTAVFVMGLKAGAAFIRETKGADALLVSKDGRSLTTAGFPVA